MSVEKRKNAWWIRFRPFGGKAVASLKTDFSTKAQAQDLERILLISCRSSDYSWLDPLSRQACLRMFRNQRWELPPDLLKASPAPSKALTLWEASEIFVNYPEIRGSKSLWRHLVSLEHLVGYFDKAAAIASLWIPELRRYRVHRLTQGAAPATVNREMSTLSKLYRVLEELQLIEVNPVKNLHKLTERSSNRGTFISFHDFETMCGRVSQWFLPIVQTAYFTGMRRGELVAMTRRQVNLDRRLLSLGSADTKEGKAKRVPVHRLLIPILEQLLKVPSITTDRVFRIEGRPVNPESFKRQWQRAVRGMEPRPRFHDLRHTWKTNALEAGIDEEIRKAILGHLERKQSVSEGYGRISDGVLVASIDRMVFDEAFRKASEL